MATADLVHEIGNRILDDPGLNGVEWDSIALVMTVVDGSERFGGYRFYGQDDYEAVRLRASGEVMDVLLDLRDAMQEDEGGAPWVQCLIQISRPSFALRMAYEYDDATRWTPEEISLDMRAFALTLRP